MCKCTEACIFCLNAVHTQELFGEFFTQFGQKCLSATLGLEDQAGLGVLAIKITNGSTDRNMTVLSLPLLLKFASNNLLSDTPEIK